MTTKNYFRSNKTLRFLQAVVLIILTSCSPVKEYRELQEVTKWEPDIANFEALDKTETYPDDAILFAGSSSIRLWSTLAEDMAPYNVIQRGYGGSKMSDYAVYADRIFSPLKCSALVLFVANDITGAAGDKRPDEVRELFGYIHHKFRKYNPGAPVFFIEITPTWRRWKAWPQVEECNETIKEWCENHSRTYFIETETAFLGPDGKPRQEFFRADSLHLNSEGYKVWNRIIKGEIEKVMRSEE